jgi:hypothetical protein
MERKPGRGGIELLLAADERRRAGCSVAYGLAGCGSDSIHLLCYLVPHRLVNLGSPDSNTRGSQEQSPSQVALACNPSGGIKVVGLSWGLRRIVGAVFHDQCKMCSGRRIRLDIGSWTHSGDSTGVTRCWRARQQRHPIVDGWNRLGPCASPLAKPPILFVFQSPIYLFSYSCKTIAPSLLWLSVPVNYHDLHACHCQWFTFTVQVSTKWLLHNADTYEIVESYDFWKHTKLYLTFAIDDMVSRP